MANSNTSVGFTNLPTQSTTGTANALLVPTAAQNYGTLPSPALVSGAGLFISIPPELSGSLDWDGHQFRIRVVGVATVNTTSTFGVNVQMGQSSTSGNNSSFFTVTSAATITGSATPFHFEVEATCLWDSTTSVLTGFCSGQFAGLAPIANAATSLITATTTPVNASALTNFQFIPFFNFSVANAANTVTVKEVLIERV